MKEAFEVKQKAFFIVYEVLSFRLTKQNGKSILGIDFSKKYEK